MYVGCGEQTSMTKRQFEYGVYGLIIQSDIALPELGSISKMEGGVVEISRSNDLDKPLEGAENIHQGVQATENEIRLQIPDLVSLSIRDGDDIRYQPAPGVSADRYRVFILGSGLGALLMQRGYLVLHGNAIDMDDGGALMCVGPSGVGKSTMMQRGYRVVADDVCPVAADGTVIPGMPRIKLWEEAAEHLSLDIAGHSRIFPEMPKYTIPLESYHVSLPLPVRTIVELDVYDESSVSVERVLGSEKCAIIRRNSYRYQYLEAMRGTASHFAKAADFASKINVFKLRRPQKGFAMDQLLDSLLDLYYKQDPHKVS